MKANVGGIDRVLRIVAGLVLIGLAVAGIGAPWTWIGVVPLLTGVFSFCPFYPLLGINSCPMKKG
jgi:hypothetical protein